MLVSISEFYEGQHSVCRNPLLQKMFVLSVLRGVWVKSAI